MNSINKYILRKVRKLRLYIG